MKQFHLEVKENEELARGRKVFDQTIYVSALERGTRDRSPRRVGPLPDRIEFKICPQKNHRGRMNYYRARSIPELCRITLTPTGETSQQQGRMEEVYITQYTHSFDREIEKPHVVAWKRAFEDSDVAHRDSKLCIVNSPVGSKNEGYPERRKSAPPGSFVFNYDTLDVPEPVLRRSKSLGTNMNDLVDFDNMDTQVGANASGNIDLEMGESAGGKMPVRPLAHETISAQKQEQVESVDLSFWEDDAFKRFDDGETSNNTTNGVRNGHVTAGDTVVDNVAADSATTSYVRNGDVRSGDVTTSYVRYDDVRGGHITTSYVRSGDVRSDDLSNGLNVPCDEITHDSREHNNMQDPTKQALSLISTLRSTVKKPDSQMFLRSVHATQTSSESTGKNHVPRKNQSKDPTPQKLPEQGVLYRSTVQPRTSSTREYPQKVTPRIISNPRKECTYQTVRQHEVLPREPVLPEKKSRKKLPAEIMPGKVVAREDLPRKDTQVETELNSDPMRNHPKDKAQVNHEYGLVKKKYISKYEPTTTVPNHSTSKPNNSYPRSDEKEKPSKRKVDQDGVKTSHFSRPKKQTSSELQDTSYDSYENVHVKSVASTKVSDKNHPSLGSSEFRFESATTNQKEDYYQEPKLILNTMEGSETHYSILPKYFENHQPKSAINVTAEHMTPDQNGDHYQEPKPILNTVERSEADYNTPQQHGENHQPRSAMNITPEQVTPKQNEKYYQEPDREVRRNKTVKTNDYNHLTRSQSTEGPASEQVSKQHYEEYHQEPNFEEKTLSGYSKQDGNTVLNINSTSSVLPGEEGSQTLNEDYYQNVDKRTREMVVTNYSVHSKQDGCTVKDHKNTSNVSSEQVERNEDHYQIPNSLVMKLKPSETSPGSHVKQARHTTYRTTIEGTTCSQEEDYYQHTNSDVNTSKTVEVDQSFHLKQERDYNKNGKPTLEQGENYYQQPNPSARKMEAQNQPQRYDEDARYHYDSQIAGGTSESRTPDEHYYQQPRFDSKTFPAPTILTKLQTNTNVYEEPKHSTTSLQKCPLDQSDRQRNDNDYNKSLPEVPTERKTSETYYETPKDAHPSSMKCPIDDTDAERSVTGDYFGQTVEHIYEQPNFETERVYEQFDYEKMNAPQSKLPSSSFKKVSDSEKDEMYEQPDKMVYVNVEDKTDRKHLDSRMRCKVVKTEHLEDTPGEVCHKPSMKQENTKRSGALVPETLHTIQADKQNNNTSSTVSTAKTPHHSDAVNPNHKQTDYQQSSITSLRSMNDLKKDLKSADQSTRVKYGGEINTKKSMVSSTSSLPPNQSDDRISNNSPNSQSAYSEGEVLPQKPEAEVSKERTRVKPKAVNGEKPQYDEISPSTYSKDNSGNTSLARFSSFNSEASYKRRLTSAWIEQQRINFRKNVSREPSLRRTKSVELHKERAASEDTADYKLKHSKSELSFEHLDAMYEPFDDKHFDTNPNKHPVKVVHAAPSEVFTKAKSLERRVEKAEEPEYFSQENISSNTESLTRSRGENAKDENPESRRIFVEGIISRQDGMATNSEVNPWREPNKKSKVRPKSADVSEFDRRTFNDQTERLWIGERSLRDAEFSQRSKPRPNSTDVSGFDVTRFSNGGTNLPMRENNRGLENNKSKPSSVQRSRVRPKSADVTTFDITSYNERQQIVSMEEKDERLAKNQSKTGSVQKSKVRPKSADVSGFDVATYNGDEPTLKHSKSEVSVNQLKAMYDPYDQNSWFSPDPASQHVNQSNTVQVEATVHDVVHRRTRSEPESRPDSSKTGRKMDQIEPKTSKGEIRSLESEPVKNITKLDSSSVLLLNVVEVEQSGQPKNSNFIRNVSGKSNSNIVSVRASEIENKKHLTMSETKVRESTRNTKQNNSDNATKSSTDQIIQNEKPIEKHRARYITGGERASVRYLSKSTDELTSNDNETMKEILPEPQGEQKPSKAPKKDGRFLNFFGRLRKSKSEPNLDKNFDILDIDSDHGGKKENSQTFKEPEKNFSETPHENSKGKSPNSSRSLKNSFYPKLKNLAKNLAKSKQSKTDSSFNDSGVDSGKDISTNQEFAETSVISESKVERENVEITESQVVRSQNVASRKIDSSISSQSVDSTKSSQYHANKHETPQLFVQIEQQSVQKDKETEPISPSSPVTSPKSAKKRFFQGGNRVKPVTVTVKDSDNNPGKTQGKTTSNSVVTSQGSQKSIANEESLEKRNRIISTSLPPTPIDNHQDRITETPVSRSVDDTALNSRPVFEADSKLPEDQMQLHSTSNESMHREAKERTTSYRITEITGKRGSVSDGNNSRFIGSSTRREHLKSIDQSASDSVVTYKNNTDKICEITLQGDDSKNPDINSKREESKAKQSKESEIAKTKHRSFFKTKISTSAGKASSSQGRDSPERKGKKEDRKEYEGTRETEGRSSEDPGQDSTVIKDDTLDNSNPVLKEESTLSSSKEIAKSREALKEEKKVKKQSLKDKEDKEKSEFGTKIKGFITKVLPQKDAKKSSSKENSVNETPGKTTVAESGSPDENNNPTTSSNDDNQQPNTSFITKSRRSIFVAKHLGESDTEKTRTSEEEGGEVRVETKKLTTSHPDKSERRYASKAKHLGDHKTIKTKSFESEKHTGQRFLTVEADDIVRENLRGSGVGSTNGKRSFPKRDAFEPKRLQNESITKTEVVDNVEAFDSVFDFFENEFNDEESKDGKEESLPKPDAQKHSKEFKKASSGLVVSNNTLEHGRNFRVSNEKENRAKRDDNQLARGDRINGLKGSGGHISTTHVNVNTTDAKCQEISPNVHTKGDIPEETTADEKQRNLEQIKGFTIKHTKTSSLVLNKSIEDDLDKLGEDSDENPQGNLKHRELNTYQGNHIISLLISPFCFLYFKRKHV